MGSIWSEYIIVYPAAARRSRMIGAIAAAPSDIFGAMKINEEIDNEARAHRRARWTAFLGHIVLGALFVPLAGLLPMRGDMDAFLWLAALAGIWAGAGPARVWKFSLGMTTLSTAIATVVMLVTAYQKSMADIARGDNLTSEGTEIYIILSWPVTLMLAFVVGLIVRGIVALGTLVWHRISGGARSGGARSGERSS